MNVIIFKYSIIEILCMNDNKVIINITKNPTNFCEESKAYKAKWCYHYRVELDKKNIIVHGGYNLNDLYNKLENTLDNYRVREKDFEITVKSEINKNSLEGSIIVNNDDLELVKVQLFKAFNNVKLDF